MKKTRKVKLLSSAAIGKITTETIPEFTYIASDLKSALVNLLTYTLRDCPLITDL